MKIDEIKLYQVRIRLKARFQASTHAADQLNHLVIRARCGDLVGWGECAVPNDPYYLGETVNGSWEILREFLIPAVLGRPFSNVSDFIEAYREVKGNTCARAGLEMAAWDLLGRATKQSLSSMLGGTRTEILSGVSLGMEDFATLCDRIETHLADGYRRIKLKMSPSNDLDFFERLRRRFPDAALMGDANSAYTLADADRLQKLDRYELMMIEQPLAWDDLVDHAALQKRLKTPICLDESIRSVTQAKNALDLGSCRVVNIKAARLGGLLAAKQVHDLCVARGVPVWCGGMLDYGIGRAANIALASLPGFSLPGDISGSDKSFDEDIVEPPIRARGGAIAVPRSPGLGFDVVEERVAERAVRVETFALAP